MPHRQNAPDVSLWQGPQHETARRNFELAQASQELAEGELEEVLATPSVAGSIGRIADVESNGGNAARARHRSDAELAIPQLQLQHLQEGNLVIPARQPQVEAPGSLAKAGDGLAHLRKQGLPNKE